MSYRVVLADDHPALLAGVRAILEKQGRAVVVGEASTPRSLLALMSEVSCEVLVMDYAMPNETGRDGRDGLDLLREVRRRYPEVHVVVLTMINNAALLQAMLAAGARAVISKSDRIAELPSVLELVRAGHVFLGKCVQERLAQGGLTLAFGRRAVFEGADISPREADVVRMLVSGSSIGEIATTLHRSPKTISNQKRSVMRKLGLANDMELLSYARENGVV